MCSFLPSIVVEISILIVEFSATMASFETSEP